MRRTPLVAAVVVFATALSMATAFATPPTGDVKFKDLTRSQAMESATVVINPGSAFMSGGYSVAPGGKSGWRHLPGTSVLSVNKGKLMLHGGDGWGGKEDGGRPAAAGPARTPVGPHRGNAAPALLPLFFL